MLNKHNLWETTPKTKQLSQSLIRGGLLRGHYAVTSFCSFGALHASRRSRHRLNEHSTGSLFNLIPPFVSSFKRGKTWGLYIYPSILYFKRQNFSSLQLHAMHFRQWWWWWGVSCACKVFKSGLKSGLKCLLQQAVIYLEFLGPFLLRKQHWKKIRDKQTKIDEARQIFTCDLNVLSATCVAISSPATSTDDCSASHRQNI